MLQIEQITLFMHNMLKLFGKDFYELKSPVIEIFNFLETLKIFKALYIG